MRDDPRTLSTLEAKVVVSGETGMRMRWTRKNFMTGCI